MQRQVITDSAGVNVAPVSSQVFLGAEVITRDCEPQGAVNGAQSRR